MNEPMEYIDILIDPKWISEKLINSENAFELLTLSAFLDFQSLETEGSMLRFEGAERIRIERLLEMMRDEYEYKEKGCESVLKAQLNILLTLVFRKMLPRVGNIDFAEHIKMHCDEKLTLESIAKECFYNPSYTATEEAAPINRIIVAGLIAGRHTPILFEIPIISA